MVGSFTRRRGGEAEGDAQPLLRRNSCRLSALPCVCVTAEWPSRWASPEPFFAWLFFLSRASRNLRFVSSEGPVVVSSSELMGLSLPRRPRPSSAGHRFVADPTRCASRHPRCRIAPLLGLVR